MNNGNDNQSIYAVRMLFEQQQQTATVVAVAVAVAAVAAKT